MRLISRFIICAAIFGVSISNAQQKYDQTLLTIGDKKVPASEFVRIFLKNNQDTKSLDSKSVEEYLKLFINFKLKVTDALYTRLDTSAAFKNELAGYRQQLSRPYMADKETEQSLINEAYGRMKYDVNASHILIAVPEQAVYSDTLKLYEKAIAIRNRIVAGEPFDVVARGTSDDHSVNNNNGVLGYFTVFQMVYPFESAAYKLKVGELSMPIRTRFGYHIIKLNDKRLAKGQVKVAHIMLMVPKDANPDQQAQVKSKILEIYKQVLNNEDFGKLATQFSQDPGSSKNNGELPWFGSGNLVPEFEKTAFGFERDGQVSEPFQTVYGWHIVKRLGRKEIGSFEEMLPEIKKKISTDMRSIISVEKMVAKIKKENNYKEDTLSLFSVVALIDSSIFKGAWQLPSLKENKDLFSISNQKHNQLEFCKYLFQYQQKPIVGSFYSIVKRAYAEWVNKTIYSFQESNLDRLFPDFKDLIQEYHDGILLFNISDLNVWSKASNDSIGLLKFYQDNKVNYTWGERVHIAFYSSTDEKQLAKANKLAISRKLKGLKPEDILLKLNKEKLAKVTLSYKVVNPDDNEVMGYKTWVNRLSPIASKEKVYNFKEIIDITTGDVKDLVDCKGQVISDYQQALEVEWLKLLHAKYPVVIDQEVFKLVVESFVKK